MGLAPRARDDHGVLLLVQHPGQGQLGGTVAPVCRQVGQAFGQLAVVLPGLAIETRQGAAEVIGGQVLRGGQLGAQQGAAQRAVGDKGHAQLRSDGQHGLLGAALPERVFVLQRRHRQHCMSAAQRVFADFGQTDGANLALGLQVRQGQHQLLDRHGRVAAVHIEQLDALQAQALQRGFAGGAGISG